MLRIMQRWLGLAKPQPANKRTSDTAVLLVRVPPQPAAAQPPPTPPDPASPTAGPAPTVALPPAPQTRPRPRVEAAPVAGPPNCKSAAATADAAPEPLEIVANLPSNERTTLPLAALGAVSDRLLRKLRNAGIRSCDELLGADAAGLVQQIKAPPHYAAKIRRYQRAIRFSRRFSAMTPHEALLLFAAHRRSAAGLGAENAGILRRDLERLLLSSHGQKLAPGGAVPELQRVRQWIVEAKTLQARKKRALLAAEPHSQLPRIAPARKGAG